MSDSTTTSPPRRSVRLTLQLDADTVSDLSSALYNLSLQVDRGEVSTGVWGGHSTGAIYELLIDPEVTHDSFHEALRAYLSEKRNEAPPCTP